MKYTELSEPAIKAGFDHRFHAVQDELLGYRDSAISHLNAPNGLVARSEDGSPSNAIRMTIPHVLMTADEADKGSGIARIKLDDEEMVEEMALGLWIENYEFPHFREKALNHEWPDEVDVKKQFNNMFEPSWTLKDFKSPYIAQAKRLLNIVRNHQL